MYVTTGFALLGLSYGQTAGAVTSRLGTRYRYTGLHLPHLGPVDEQRRDGAHRPRQKVEADAGEPVLFGESAIGQTMYVTTGFALLGLSYGQTAGAVTSRVEADAGEPVLGRQAERHERREAGAEQPGEVGGERRASTLAPLIFGESAIGQTMYVTTGFALLGLSYGQTMVHTAPDKR
jgi:hypothetical protein